MDNIDKITALLETIEDLAPAGFAIAFHIRLTSSEFQFQTYPKAWMEVYSQNGYVLSDPTVSWAFSNEGYIRWSDLSDQDVLKIYEQSSAYGMKYGAAIGIEADDTRSIGGFARPDREYTDEEMQQLSDYIRQLHLLTASKTGMDDALRNELHDLSVKMTHPS